MCMEEVKMYYLYFFIVDIVVLMPLFLQRRLWILNIMLIWELWPHAHASILCTKMHLHFVSLRITLRSHLRQAVVVLCIPFSKTTYMLTWRFSANYLLFLISYLFFGHCTYLYYRICQFDSKIWHCDIAILFYEKCCV